ncbi:MAG: AsnC family transcriptional regulator [Hyphomicrobiales bacterium]|nr:AsnC family transcriptional regulator [Hyphomicrobiales bacterium]MCP5373783.1 AsnC family transcriptional regulator [Hyphomicrobiales bacterium]
MDNPRSLLALDEFERHLLDGFQRDFPLTPRPFADIAARLGVTEAEVLDALREMKEMGLVTRVGAVFRTGSLGASTLAAMAVPAERLAQVADLVSAHGEVNHNYEREHRFNLWFVVTAADGDAVRAVLDDISAATGIAVLDLPMVEGYHLDLGFTLSWH